MRRLRSGNGRGRICVCVAETTAGKALQAMERAASVADLIEIRMDYLKAPRWDGFLPARQNPVIVTNRRKEEGGRFAGGEKERFSLLREAIAQRVDFVDVEMNSHQPFLQTLLRDRRNTGIILSFHDFEKTPSLGDLRKLCRNMAGRGADIMKIVPFARTLEDNLRVLSLLSYARERRQKMVAFCMGEKGRMSRVFAPLLGAAWTYASLSRQRAAAPGQLTAPDLRDLWEKLG